MSVDFIVERDGITYSVEVKNWIKYEYYTRKEIRPKISIAKQLEVVPFIIARYIDPEMIKEIIYVHNGLAYSFEKLIFPPKLMFSCRKCTTTTWLSYYCS